MEINESGEGDVTILSIEGEITINELHILKEKIYGLIDTDRLRVLIDFSGVTFLDSTSLGTFLIFSRKLETAGGTLALCALSEPIQEIFDLVGFTEFFSIYPSADDALASMSLNPTPQM